MPKHLESSSLGEGMEVSRNSGLHHASGTFGGAERFNMKIGRGAHSPQADKFYSRNQINKRWDEVGLQCSQGIGPRKELVYNGFKNVGPGSYEIVQSAKGRKSPLDGKDFCNMSIHQKLPSKLVPANLCSPGPHHKYELRKPLDHHCPKYAIPAMTRFKRHDFPEDKDQPGPGAYQQDYYSVTKSSSSPTVGGKKIDQLERKQTTKSTFGTADRFRAGKQTCSPQGDMYYAHSKFLTSEDYLQQSKSCTFGHGTKTDFANPYKGPKSQVSPVTYKPCTSSAYPTSPLDGLTNRSMSPNALAVKEMLATRKMLRSQRLSMTSSKSEGQSQPTSPTQPAGGARSGPDPGGSVDAAGALSAALKS
mmetsp:Transcript_24377/g.61878  ORF Transcript_24377/g.61878 Transcript_24377/m.61878 type:complete len:362 (-) Transcript_24377:32-1117(-)